MYGDNVYGLFNYGKETTLTEDEINSNKPKLLEYLPHFLRGVLEFKEWDNVSGYEISKLNLDIKDIIAQCFIDTATWGLNLWEGQIGVSTDINKSYEERREIIKARLRGSGTVTKKMIKETAEAFSGGDVDIIEHTESYSFTVRFVGVKGIPKNMAAFIEMINTIKPAHLDYDIKYTYTVWNDIKSKAWSNLSNKTWNELKVYE